ncbi:DUF1365 domain-containing protein [Agrobacterium vitis]|uniref:DUF1365 domain-containing protein n=1 Tax=Agrobacterium vitis TaxID=373 RepID=UPI0015D911C9|nr:DUF1365 domain-containing protein [Agrobacterium vitis]BCH57663.1 DUF1365 domain-containing protein [Agrobacterium vitis]
MSWSSAIFTGAVVHQRHRPKKHSLRYQVFCLLVDLDELPAIDKSLWLLGYNRRAILRIDDRDHGLGIPGGLKAWVANHVERAGLNTEGMKVSMLCYPRMFGYVFNPLTLYYCYGPSGTLLALLYEVENTFHERHTYVIPASVEEDGAIRHACAKQMYVSPFMPMECLYRFKIVPPGETVTVAINEADEQGPLLYASFCGKRRTLDDRALLRVLVRYPLMTLKVMGAIHWEALKLWVKGVPLHRHRKAQNPIASSIIPPEAANARSPS